jgi:hypothetical protein
MFPHQPLRCRVCGTSVGGYRMFSTPVAPLPRLRNVGRRLQDVFHTSRSAAAAAGFWPNNHDHSLIDRWYE